MTDVVKGYFAGGFTSAIGLVVFFLGFGRMRRHQLIRDTPQSKIRSMAIGLVEIFGKVVPDKHFISPLSQTDCVYYRYTIEEYQERSTHNGTESKIVTIVDQDERTPFYLLDDTGQVIVEPEKAEVNLLPKKIFFRKAKQRGMITSVTNTWQQASNAVRVVQQGMVIADALSTDVSMEGVLPVETKSFAWHNPQIGDRKYTEYYIEPNEQLYVLGSAANRGAETSELTIHKGENESTFIISDKSEKNILRRLFFEAWLCFVLGGLFFTIGVIFLLKMLNVFPT